MSANRPPLSVNDDPLKLVRRNVEAAKPLDHALEFRECPLRRFVLGDHGRLMEATGAIDVRLDDVERVDSSASLAATGLRPGERLSNYRMVVVRLAPETVKQPPGAGDHAADAAVARHDGGDPGPCGRPHRP
jgi:hypothetical protein